MNIWHTDARSDLSPDADFSRKADLDMVSYQSATELRFETIVEPSSHAVLDLNPSGRLAAWVEWRKHLDSPSDWSARTSVEPGHRILYPDMGSRIRQYGIAYPDMEVRIRI